MPRTWEYETLDKKGNIVREAEVLTDEQGALDDRVVRDFQSLENEVAQGRTIKDGIHASRVKELREKLEELPKNRAEHWNAELKRIGAAEAEKTKEALKKEADERKEREEAEEKRKKEEEETHKKEEEERKKHRGGK